MTHLKQLTEITEQEEPLQEKCGIIAVLSPTYHKQLPLALLAAGGVQHRGQHGVGLVMNTKKGLISHMGNGLLREVFTAEQTDKLNKSNNWLILHCRYGTNGGYDERNLQPCLATSEVGVTLAVAHNGEFVATDNMRKNIDEKLPETVSDTYLFSRMLSQAKGASWQEKVLHVLEKVNGAYNLVIGVNDCLFVARDIFGLRPLMLGKVGDSWIVASETHALDKVGAKIIREFHRGELAVIDKKGVHTLRKGLNQEGHFCDFEWAYFSRPDSFLPTHTIKTEGNKPQAWLSVASFRERCGSLIAEEEPISNASFAVGAPDSGIAVTTGFANTLKIPYRQVIVRDHFDPYGSHRLFMKDENKEAIKHKVLGKLSLIADKRIWKDAVVVVGDDSIVRGNVTRQITQAIFSLGAKEVHWIIGFPPVQHHCHLGVSMRTEIELIAYRNKGNTKKIAKEIGATTIRYISPRGFLKAKLQTGVLNSPKNEKEIFLANGGCGGCITGKYPINKDGSLYSFTGQ